MKYCGILSFMLQMHRINYINNHEITFNGFHFSKTHIIQDAHNFLPLLSAELHSNLGIPSEALKKHFKCALSKQRCNN